MNIKSDRRVMKKVICLIAVCCLLMPSKSYSWGKTGHRIVGYIAYQYLNKKAKKQVKRVLGNESLAMVGNYMDFIRSDSKYRFAAPWHYVNIPEGKRYKDITPNPDGDIIATIERLSKELKSGQFSMEDEAFALKCLVHLVGDIHQPLHVGKASDRGGNDIKLQWFDEETNLHRVWDENLINFQQLSYTEFGDHINHASKAEITSWQSTRAVDWAHESQDLVAACYNLPESGRISFRYNFEHIATLERRLLQAGIRLAGLLNEIYQ